MTDSTVYPMADPNFQVAVVIVNHNAGEALAACLKSALSQSREVVLVDNASEPAEFDSVVAPFAANPSFAGQCRLRRSMQQGSKSKLRTLHFVSQSRLHRIARSLGKNERYPACEFSHWDGRCIAFKPRWNGAGRGAEEYSHALEIFRSSVRPLEDFAQA